MCVRTRSRHKRDKRGWCSSAAASLGAHHLYCLTNLYGQSSASAMTYNICTDTSNMIARPSHCFLSRFDPDCVLFTHPYMLSSSIANNTTKNTNDKPGSSFP